MTPLPNNRTLETGSMVNPATGQATAYEEVWQDIEPICTTSAWADENLRLHNPGIEPMRTVMVLTLQDDANQARGMVVRVGQYCQGVVRQGEYFSLDRWRWQAAGGWQRECRVGDLMLPCGWCFEPQMGGLMGVGARVRYQDYEWVVVERDEF